MPYVAFGSPATAKDRRSGAAWKQMYHLFRYDEERLIEHYHKRV